jgi:hypothetical protein
MAPVSIAFIGNPPPWNVLLEFPLCMPGLRRITVVDDLVRTNQCNSPSPQFTGYVVDEAAQPFMRAIEVTAFNDEGTCRVPL